jgi:hypothetical protein
MAHTNDSESVEETQQRMAAARLLSSKPIKRNAGYTDLRKADKVTEDALKKLQATAPAWGRNHIAQTSPSNGLNR